MKYLNKILGIIMVIIFITLMSQNSHKNILSAYETNGKFPLKVGVMEYKSDDEYIKEVHKSLEQIQSENPDKVQFLFFDGKNNQEVQNASIRMLLQEGVDILLVNLVDINSAQTVISMIKEQNVPVILYNREPYTTDAIKSYGKAIFIGTDAREAGILQGNILVDLWKNNRETIDKNRDGRIQYIMLKGEPNSIETIERTRYSIGTINNAGISTDELASVFCGWSEDTAEYFMKTLYLSHGNKIEAILSNNDAMAIGAIRALQTYGYNNGNLEKTIPIVGVDAIPEARELIEKGYMTGTVLQDANEMAKALYICGINLVNHKSAIDGTSYKFDDTGVSIRIPYQEYTPIK